MAVDTIKVTAGKYKHKVKTWVENGRRFFKFGYKPKVIDEIRCMKGARWHGYDDDKPRKMWSVEECARNSFQLEFLKGENPYHRWDHESGAEIVSDRPLYEHQKTQISFILDKHYCVIAAEMGTGKTLSCIEAMEQGGISSVWYVGPKSGVKAVSRELVKWNAQIEPEMFTYEGLVKHLKHWNGESSPRAVIFDESSKIKTHGRQRSQAAAHLANSIREEWGWDGYVVLMSGTPAPKSPVDWWHQCEVAYPGFIKEGNVYAFKKRLCIVEDRESAAGGAYPHLVTWLDDSSKCATCGEISEHENHIKTKGTAFSVKIDVPDDESFKQLTEQEDNPDYHDYEASVNQVQNLYKRMKGLVLVQFKKDCLDLPEKQYRVIKVTPNVETLRAARLIQAKCTRAIEVLTLHRELSDGFQYSTEQIGERICAECFGVGSIHVPEVDDEQICIVCGGSGRIPDYKRSTEYIECPKDPEFLQLLDDHEDIGRFTVWSGFTGTVDKLVAICHKYGWATLRVDGRGFVAQEASGDSICEDDTLDAMDYSNPRRKELLDRFPKLCFVGHPQAGGMALTLTASPTELFYSNPFNGEARMQAEDRGHRAGMNINRGLTIIDFDHLPSDMLVLSNLRQKKRLQNMSMGELAAAMETITS